MKKKKKKPWKLSLEECEQIRRMPRQDLDRLHIAQQEQIRRFLRVIKKLRDSITELQSLGM
jgi:hypothetical protein